MPSRQTSGPWMSPMPFGQTICGSIARGFRVPELSVAPQLASDAEAGMELGRRTSTTKVAAFNSIRPRGKSWSPGHDVGEWVRWHGRKRCAVGAARASVGTHSTLLLHSSGTESRPSVAVLPPQEGGGLHLRCSIGAVHIISSMRTELRGEAMDGANVRGGPHREASSLLSLDCFWFLVHPAVLPPVADDNVLMDVVRPEPVDGRPRGGARKAADRDAWVSEACVWHTVAEWDKFQGQDITMT